MRQCKKENSAANYLFKGILPLEERVFEAIPSMFSYHLQSLTIPFGDAELRKS